MGIVLGVRDSIPWERRIFSDVFDIVKLRRKKDVYIAYLTSRLTAKNFPALAHTGQWPRLYVTKREPELNLAICRIYRPATEQSYLCLVQLHPRWRVRRRRKYKKLNTLMRRSTRNFNIPFPGQSPGIWTFEDWIIQISAPSGQNSVQMLYPIVGFVCQMPILKNNRRRLLLSLIELVHKHANTSRNPLYDWCSLYHTCVTTKIQL